MPQNENEKTGKKEGNPSLSVVRKEETSEQEGLPLPPFKKPEPPEPGPWIQERERRTQRLRGLGEREIQLRGIIQQSQEDLENLRLEIAALHGGIDMGDFAVRTYIELLRREAGGKTEET